MRNRDGDSGGIAGMRYIGRLISPFVIRVGIAVFVELVAIVVLNLLQVTDLTSYATVIGVIGAVVAIPVLYGMFDKGQKEAIWKRQGPIWEYLGILVMSVAATVAVNTILLLTPIGEYSESYQETAALLYSPSLVMQIISVGIIYPILEECMFRGLLYQRLQEKMTRKIAWILSAILFGVYHGNLVQFIYATIMGCMLVYLYETYGTLKAPIAAHICMNLTSVLFTQYNLFGWVYESVVRTVAVTILSAILVCVSGMWIQKNCKKS